MLALGSGWMRTYGTEEYFEDGSFVRQTTDGGYVVLSDWGSETSTSADIRLIKTDSLGDTIWTKIYSGGGTGWDEGYCVQQTSDGGYIISGFTNCEIVGGWVGDIWLLKTDSIGDTMWTRIFRGSHRMISNWVEQTSDGGYILTSNKDQAYLWLIKMDENGDTMWTKTYLGWWGRCVRQTDDGGYIVACGNALFKTDSEGDSLWVKPWRGGEVEQTGDSGYILVGGVEIQGGTELRLTKTDAEGDTLCTRTYGGPQEDGGSSVQQTTDGCYVIVGETRSFGAGKTDVWLLKTDSIGDTLWTRTFGDKHNDHGYSVQQTSDGGYVITGSFGEPLDYGFPNVWLIKTDSLGYVGVKEEPPVQVELNWEVISSIGPQITLRYTNRPQGFSASIFDATGRKVDELRSAEQSGAITWGNGYGPGVYFIRERDEGSTARVVIIH